MATVTIEVFSKVFQKMSTRYQQQIKDSLITAFVVGIILIFINHVETIMALSFSITDLLQWSLNFVVPFTVSLYSRLAALKKTKGTMKVTDA